MFSSISRSAISATWAAECRDASADRIAPLKLKNATAPTTRSEQMAQDTTVKNVFVLRPCIPTLPINRSISNFDFLEGFLRLVRTVSLSFISNHTLLSQFWEGLWIKRRLVLRDERDTSITPDYCQI